jgi:hypothetical protein
MAAKAGERPVASPLARWQAARTGQVTGLRHTPVTLETDLERDFLKLLDGTRDREALRKEWDRLVDVTGSTMSLDSVLDKFCRLSLLVS